MIAAAATAFAPKVSSDEPTEKHGHNRIHERVG
jgi:hypothetical protein